jgi:hypothetical protein
VRWNSLNAAPLREILERWISKYEGYWANTMLRVKDLAEEESFQKHRPRKKKA